MFPYPYPLPILSSDPSTEIRGKKLNFLNKFQIDVFAINVKGV